MARPQEILVVDDEPIALRAASAVLERAGFSVRVAASGAEGYDLACQLQPDCILLDIDMPCMDGGEVADKLERNPETRAIPVVFFTGLLKDEEMNASGMVGRHQYVAKPARRDMLLAAIEKVLGGR